MNYYGSHDCSRKLEKQIKWNDYIKQTVWSEIVTEKIKKQSKFLKELEKFDEALLLDEYTTQIELSDVTNREGHAAKVYFNAILEWILLEVLTILLMRDLIMDIVYYYLHSIEK